MTKFKDHSKSDSERRHRSSAFKLALLGASGFALAATASPVFAQETADDAADQTSDLEEDRLNRLGVVTVNARRRDESLLEAPVAVTSIGGDTIDDYQVTSLTDLTTFVPGMVTSKAASGSSASIFLRGVGSTALSAGFDQSVSFVIDGLPMSRGREISLPQFDIARAEVLKGPQALFFGKNTTAGLISIVSNGPTDTFESGLTGGYGFEAEQYYAEGFVSGPLSDTFRGRVAFRYSDSEGAFDNSAAASFPSPAVNPLTFTPLGFTRSSNSDKRGFAETLGVRTVLDWDATENLSFDLRAGYSKVEDGGPTDILERLCGGGRTVPQPSTPAPGFTVPASPNTDCNINGVADSASIPVEVATGGYRFARNGEIYADFESKYAILKSELDLGSIDVVSLTSFYNFEQEDANNVSGESFPGNFTQFADYDQFSQELRFSTDFDGPFNVMFGGFYSSSEFIFNTDAYIFPFVIPGATPVTFSRDNGFEHDSLSFFVEGTFDITDTLDLSIGARWSDEERDSFQRSNAANPSLVAEFPPGSGTLVPQFPAGVELLDNFEDDNLSPQATLRYQPDSSTTMYASYKEGFKTGGYNISQVVALPAQLNPQGAIDAGKYTSETAAGFEAGYRRVFADDTFIIDATIYSYEYDDLQVQVFDPTSVSLIADNAGTLKTQGIEADFNWLVSDAFSLRGAIAYNDAEYQDFVGACFEGQTIAQGCAFNANPLTGAFSSQDYEGRRPPKAPEVAGRVGFTYDFDFGPNSGGFQLVGDAAYTGEYNFTDTLRPDGVQDSFWKYDMSLRYTSPSDRWHLSLIGRNLSDELIVAAANDIPFTGGLSQGTGTTTGTVSDMSAFVDNPREVYVELGVRF